MIGFGSHGWSSTGWETSFYGGYDRTLYDMPDVKVNYDVRVYTDHKSKVSYYNGQKLLKTFLLRVKTLGLTNHLLHKSTMETRKGWGPFSKETRCIKASKQGIESALSYVIANETELKNLFEHYKDDIINSDIEFNLKGDDDDKSKHSIALNTSRVNSFNLKNDWFIKN